MSVSAAIAEPLLRRAFGRRTRPSDPLRTSRVRIGSSELRAPVSRRGSGISRRTVMNIAGERSYMPTPSPTSGEAKASARGSSMDLRRSFPHSMRVTLEGYVHLARMIDKCRAVLACTEGEYIYPCPMDERLMEFAGIRAEEFTAAVKANPSDEAVAKWLTQTAKAR